MPLILTTPFKSAKCTTADTLINTYAGPAPQSGSGYHGIAIDDDGLIWISDAFDNDLIRTFDPSTGTFVDSYAAGGTNPRGMVYDGNNHVWFAVYVGGLLRKININTRVITTVQSITTPWNVVRHPSSDWVWVDKDNTNNIQGFNAAGGSPNYKTFGSGASSARAIYSDASEDVWFAGSDEILKHYDFITGNITTITGTSGVRAIGEGLDGYIYASAPTNTIYRVNKGTLSVTTTITLSGQVPSDYGKLLTDTAGYIWFANKRFNPNTDSFLTAVAGAPTTQGQNVGGQGNVQSSVDGHVYMVQTSESNLYRMACS